MRWCSLFFFFFFFFFQLPLLSAFSNLSLECFMYTNQIPLTSPAIGSPLEYRGSSSGSTLLPLALDEIDEMNKLLAAEKAG